MFAIQSGKKFLQVKYFIGQWEVYDVVVSDTPKKTYKTSDVAMLDVSRVVDWLDQQIEHTEKVIKANEASVAKNSKVLERLQAKLEGLLDLPCREVERQVATVRKSIARAESDIGCLKSWIPDYKRALVRYTKIRSAGARIVKLQQTVEAR